MLAPEQTEFCLVILDLAGRKGMLAEMQIVKHFNVPLLACLYSHALFY